MKNIISKILTVLCLTAMVCCSNESLVKGSKNDGVSEVITNVFEPTTEAGKTYSRFTTLMINSAEKLVSTINNYVDLDSEGGRGDIKTINDIGKLLPNDLSILKRKIVNGRGDEEEISLDYELDEIIREFNAVLEQIKPNPSDAQTLDFCDATIDGVIIGGDMVIKNDNIIGAITIEMLNAEARGESVENISKELECIATNIFGKTTETESRGLREVSTKLWNDGVIYYRWGSLADRYKKLMREAMNEWEKGTNYKVQFEEVPTNGLLETQSSLHLNGVITIKNEDGNFAGSSYVGYMPGNSYLSLNERVLASYSDKKAKGTCLHELGHVLGLQHEHQRWDRDKYIAFDDPNDKKDTNNYGIIPKTKQTIKWVSQYWWTVFLIGVPIVYPVKETVTNSITYGEFDYDSIMMYPATFRAKVAKQGYKIGDMIERKQTLSTNDIAAIKAMY